MKEKRVKDYYNGFSQDYDRIYLNLQFEKYNIILADETMFPEWVLDHGGGTGLLSQWSNYPMLTMDISEAMIRAGRTGKIKYQGVVADMNRIPLRDKSVTTIISFTALQNSSNVKQALNEILRISDPKARLILSFLEKKFPQDIFFKWMEENKIDFQITNNVVEDIVITAHF